MLKALAYIVRFTGLLIILISQSGFLIASELFL